MTSSRNFKEELVGVFGYPIAGNPTVVMQDAGFKTLGINWRYLTIEVRQEDLEAAMMGMRAFNMRGVNLTMPHKVEALKYLDVVKPDAALMGAVNTVVREGDALVGENTDGKGFLRSLVQDAKVTPHGKNIVILGSGGAARAIAIELALAGAGIITIVNRSVERGSVLTDLLNTKTSVRAAFKHWIGKYSVPDDTAILINATSIGLTPNDDEKPDIDYGSIASAMTVCDVIPAKVTPFLRAAENRGARIIDGLGMLVYQGAIAFKLWTGFDAPVEAMREALLKAFGG